MWTCRWLRRRLPRSVLVVPAERSGRPKEVVTTETVDKNPWNDSGRSAQIISRLKDIPEDQSDVEDDPDLAQESAGEEETESNLSDVSDTSDSQESSDSARSSEENALDAVELLESTAPSKSYGRVRGSTGRRGRSRRRGASRAFQPGRNNADSNAQGDVPGPAQKAETAKVSRKTAAGRQLSLLKTGNKVSATHGLQWIVTEPGKEALGRKGGRYEGPPPYSKRHVQTDNACSAWRLIFKIALRRLRVNRPRTKHGLFPSTN